MKEIEITYLPKIKDYLDAYTTYEQQTLGYKIDKVVAVSLILFGFLLAIYTFYFHLTNEFIMYSVLFVLIGILDFIGIFDLGKFVYLMRLKMTSKFNCQQKIIFSETGIYYEMLNIKSQLEWTFYTDFLENETTLILIYGKRQYSVIPKSSFKDNDFIVLKDFLLKKFTNKVKI
ncbi:YcxB family protein [Phocoenobacter skyensis]|uniref:YcxB family protein n=1 Tax=Phocoenobacter skyensis TaxID=97481 RepID=A0A1H7VR57_9PAST|nr:YcxB family protein [Pasteurella skyensis]MDP8078888.1 YcxB family protein [Pasteurella skyensis]MDP8084799.1 YcxB family protein [Pasteurella skyensis]MDP8184861.1 YcxB family protein [Pasteurella skyensis]QLB22529.1 hypothetical protein A6B44_04655 [Pasteurella skyensis]SEM11650.1 YcxB-like protein [Pasteurella skyensis]